MCSRLSARTESQGAGKTLAPLSMKRSAAMDIIRPEVLAPAGDAERLKAAVYYGADAVYMGGTRFGMRAAPKNFSDDELAKAVSFAHENGVKVYLTCNIIPNTAQLKELPEFLESASAARVDALIITDLGVLSYAKSTHPKCRFIYLRRQVSPMPRARVCSLTLARKEWYLRVNSRSMSSPTSEPECPKKWSSNVSSTAQCVSHIQDAACSQTILLTGTQIKANVLSPAAGNTASWSAPARANISPLKKLQAAHI